jgi:hypothetical protein
MRRAAATLFALPLLALAACSESSAAKAQAAVDDMIEELDLPPAQADCLHEKLDGYTDDELGQIQEDNAALEDADFSDPAVVEQASPELQQFYGDVASCISPTTTG